MGADTTTQENHSTSRVGVDNGWNETRLLTNIQEQAIPRPETPQQFRHELKQERLGTHR